MTRKSRTTIIAVLLLLAVALYFISGTYAKYASEFVGTGTVNVAKWNVKVTGAETKDFTLTLNPDDTENVVNGKIAPSYSASGEIEVDLSETEVAVELKAKVGELTGAFAGKDEKVTVETSVEKQGSAEEGEGDLTSGYKIALPSGEAFTAENGKYKVKVTVTWTNTNSPSQDADDTTLGEAAGSSQVKVTLNLDQQVKA